MQNSNDSPPRTALYIRVSTEEQAMHGLSLEAQQTALEEWAKKNKCKIVGAYIDSGKTARKSIKSRTELQRLLSDVEADKIDLIIFTKLDRWFRNIKDYYKVQEILENHGVNWKTIFENYDTTTANGRLHINIMLSIAQDEADRTSERIKAVFANKLVKGEGTCPNLPIGYKLVNSRVVIDEERAPIAVDLFEHYYTHHSQRAAGRAMIAAHGVHLHPYTVKRMLTNPIYKGAYRGIEGFCEPLIDATKFNEIQRIIKEKNIKVNPGEYAFIFSGLLVCGECGHKMAGNAQKRTYSGGRDGYYVCYRCNCHFSNGTCTNSRVAGEKKVEEYLLNNVMTEISNYIYKIDCERKKTHKPKVNKSEIRRKLERLKELYVNDLIDLDMYKKDYEELTAKLSTIEPEEKPINLTPLKQFLKSGILETYHTMNNEAKRIMWRGIIDRLIISADNKITIQFTN